ncbi:MAG: hypothetical protein LBC85_02265, partial [Fibromonadaceae bacterium]|nr:hypothetical protein [Fibromonadaceae bacterium]
MTAEEFDRRMAAILESFEKSRLEDEKRRAEDEKKAEQRRLEAEQRRAEDEKKAEQRKVEYEKSKADMEAYLKALGDKIDKTDNKVEHAKTDIAGISNSNGLAAEDYFYNSLEKTLTLGGLHFDYAQRGNRRTRKTPDGKKIKVKGQYDVLLVNGDSVAIVEIKYKADKED